ncbi:MAG: hypothetical protein RIQ53_2316 [Pseudomonadota bacterium]
MFERILIANRGEIACRVIATARRLGIATVAVHSDVDAGARHVRLADAAQAIGPAPARQSYLAIDRLIAAARASGAQAVHPGYGFLSENADFAEACEAAGLVFIGPPAAANRAMGSKSAAKALMAAAGVPLIPGYHGEDQQVERLAEEARRIGWPVLIKASAGGGGKGMRRVDAPEDFAAALASCQREAAQSFGDARVLVERCVARPRHVEIQVFADRHGHVVHLGERDCSVQRRHQKVLEESPAPGMTPERRAAMGRAAVEAARAVGYVGAGTVEFILDAAGDFHFMEMNTRLQVEHPVTEMVTGLDLVEWQLRVAAGEPLPLRQEEIRLRGHAIEARICAEDPDRGFLPCTGRIRHLALPATGPHVRVDHGLGLGDEIGAHYDPMLAKLIVWDEDRPRALARLRRALADWQLLGVGHNVAFLQRLVATRAFTEADLDTALIPREQAALQPPCDPPPMAVWALAAAAVHGGPTLAEATGRGAVQGLAGPTLDADAASAAVAATGTWQRDDGWRLNAPACVRVRLRWSPPQGTAQAAAADGPDGPIQGHAAEPVDRTAVLGFADDGRVCSLWIEDPAAAAGSQPQPVEVRIGRSAAAPALPSGPGAALPLDLHLRLGDQGLQARVVLLDEACHVDAEGRSWRLERVTGDPATTARTDDPGSLRAPMPGRIVAQLVAPGAAVRRGQALVVLEAMKMEHSVTAPADGVLRGYAQAVGDPVAEGAVLVDVEVGGTPG